MTGRRRAREAAAVVVQTVVLGEVAVVLFGVFGRDLSTWATFGVAGVVVVAAHVQFRLREREEMQPAAWVDERFDRPFGRITELRQQLQWSLESPGPWHQTLQPQLAAVVDDRLRRHHGLDRSRHPERARQVMGEPLWAALYQPAGPSPELPELVQLVGRIERL